jgi:hypothetical protein
LVRVHEHAVSVGAEAAFEILLGQSSRLKQNSRRQLRQLHEVPAAQRKFDDLLAVDHLAAIRSLLLEGGRVNRDGDLFLSVADLT